ncbi:MAG: IclR family transcriptional regulator [Clostridiales bacterium]|nr:IclR family transcriptional regulator [Clostridiales bacterium]
MNNSAVRVLEIMELIASSGPMTVSEVSRRMEIPKTSAFDIIKILAENGFLTQADASSKTYAVGLSAYRVGMAYLERTDLYSTAHPLLTSLCSEFGQTCYLAIEDGGFIVYIDKAESQSPLRVLANLGTRNRMYLTGLGKAMLAGYGEERVREIMSSGFERRTENTIMDIDSLLRELEKVRENGCAFDMGEDSEHIRCVAAPVRGRDGSIAAAVSIAMPDTVFTDDMRERAVKRITETALAISAGLGYTGGRLY